MSHPSKVRGTKFESAVRDWLNARGVRAFRPALHGAQDKGDIFGVDGWTLQLRDTAKLDFAGAVDDAREQAANAKTPFFVAIVKRRRKSVAEAYAVMSLEQWAKVVGLSSERPIA